jgi:hypothetical protein
MNWHLLRNNLKETAAQITGQIEPASEDIAQYLDRLRIHYALPDGKTDPRNEALVSGNIGKILDEKGLNPDRSVQEELGRQLVRHGYVKGEECDYLIQVLQGFHKDTGKISRLFTRDKITKEQAETLRKAVRQNDVLALEAVATVEGLGVRGGTIQKELLEVANGSDPWQRCHEEILKAPGSFAFSARRAQIDAVEGLKNRHNWPAGGAGFVRGATGAFLVSSLVGLAWTPPGWLVAAATLGTATIVSGRYLVKNDEIERTLKRYTANYELQDKERERPPLKNIVTSLDQKLMTQAL